MVVGPSLIVLPFPLITISNSPTSPSSFDVTVRPSVFLSQLIAAFPDVKGFE